MTYVRQIKVVLIELASQLGGHDSFSERPPSGPADERVRRLADLARHADGTPWWENGVSDADAVRRKLSPQIERLLSKGAPASPETVRRFARLSSASESEGARSIAFELLSHPETIRAFERSGETAELRGILQRNQAVDDSAGNPRVLIQFGLWRDAPDDLKARGTELARMLGTRLAGEPFNLIYGGRHFAPGFELCRVFVEALGPDAASKRLTSYIPEQMLNKCPDKDRMYLGSITTRWGKPVSRRPDLVKGMDVMLLMRGGDKSDELISIAELVGKPIIPIPHFGGSAKRIYERVYRESLDGDRRMRTLVERLGQQHASVEQIAETVISLLHAHFDSV